MKLDLKSVLIGALSVVCFVSLTGAKDSHEGEVGRYQVALTDAGGGASAFEIVIDTRTGDVVRRIKTSIAPISKDWTKLKNYLKEQESK
jgi:hypothetical protein